MAIEEEPEAGIPEWVVTFGDMMSLLLTFFIMLVSLSEIKEKDMYQAMVESMRRQFGHDTSTASLSPGRHTPRTAELAKLASQGRSQRSHLMKGGDKVKAPEGENPRVRIIRPGSQVNTGTVVYFPEFEAGLTEQARRDLQTEAVEIGGKPQVIEIRGHASQRPLPFDSVFRDAHDLAYARARAVKEFLISLGIASDRMRLSVAADQEPIYHGADAVKLQRNARVEVFLLDELAPVGPPGATTTKSLKTIQKPPAAAAKEGES